MYCFITKSDTSLIQNICISDYRLQPECQLTRQQGEGGSDKKVSMVSAGGAGGQDPSVS